MTTRPNLWILALMLTTRGLLPAHAASARPVAVDLQLVIAVDVSASMEPTSSSCNAPAMSRRSATLTSSARCLSGDHRRIALTYVEWADQRPGTRRSFPGG